MNICNWINRAVHYCSFNIQVSNENYFHGIVMQHQALACGIPAIKIPQQKITEQRLGR